MEEWNSAVYEGLTFLSLALSLPHKYCDDSKEDARLARTQTEMNITTPASNAQSKIWFYLL